MNIRGRAPASIAIGISLCLGAAGALAQSTGDLPGASAPGLAKPGLTQPDRSTNGPAGTAVQTQTTKTVVAPGTEVDTSQSFKKNQSYTSGSGQLSAQTHIQTTGPVSVVKPVSPSQETPQ